MPKLWSSRLWAFCGVLGVKPADYGEKGGQPAEMPVEANPSDQSVSDDGVQ
jgi:hypothetical protein